MKSVYLLSIFSILFYSCTSISLRDGLEINEKADWLQSGRNESKTNVADSGIVLKLPLRELWKFNTDAAFDRSSLSASDGVLFVSCLNGDIFAVDITKGSNIGKINTKSKSSNTAALIMKNIIVITFTDGLKNYIAGYDFVTGEYKWKKLTPEIVSAPAYAGNDIFYCTTNGSIYKIDSKNGRNVWIYKNEFSFSTSPSIYNGLLFAGDVKGNLRAIDIENGDLRWSYKTGEGIFSDVSICNDNLYFGSDDGNFYCLDTSGALIWKKNLGTKFLSSSTFHKNKVICTGISGAIFSLNIESGVIDWVYETKGTIAASPVLNGDKIYVGSFDRYFYCLDANNGDLIWKHEFDERIRASSVIWKKYLIIACDDKSVYCFK